MNDFRMLVLDIDGTTITRDRRIAEADRRAVAILQDRGVIVTIATGRLYSGAQPVAVELGLDGVIACMNGSELVNLLDDERILQRTVSARSLTAARGALADRDLISLLFATDGVHHCGRAEPLLRYLSSWSGTFTIHDDIFSADNWNEARGVLAIGAAGTEEEARRAQEIAAPLLCENMETLLFPSAGGHWYLKFRDKREDKGSALRRMAKARGFEASQCIAVGDWLNDLPMLRVAGRSFAMGQGAEEVRKTATDVLRATSDNGGAIAEIAQLVWGVHHADLGLPAPAE